MTPDQEDIEAFVLIARNAIEHPPGADSKRLDFVLRKQAFAVWCNRDGSICQCQLMTQDEDEVYHPISGMDRFFNDERSAIDAAIAADR